VRLRTNVGARIHRRNAGRVGQRVKDEAQTTWVKPKLVAEVKFTERTSAGEMRHLSFLGLREDRKPEDVALEKEARSPK
jgi:ATP-dependent DNA ligase